jgi:hypothetical protein
MIMAPRGNSPEKNTAIQALKAELIDGQAFDAVYAPIGLGSGICARSFAASRPIATETAETMPTVGPAAHRTHTRSP